MHAIKYIMCRKLDSKAPWQPGNAQDPDVKPTEDCCNDEDSTHITVHSARLQLVTD